MGSAHEACCLSRHAQCPQACSDGLLFEYFLYAAGAVNSLGVVLEQEIDRFNRLLHHVTASLQELSKALKVTLCSCS